MNNPELMAHKIVWEAVEQYARLRLSHGGAEGDATAEIVAALMDAATRLNIMRGLARETFVHLASKHYELTQRLMREDAARTGN